MNFFEKPNKKELERILHLKERNPTEKARMIDQKISYLFAKNSNAELRPYQSLALFEIYEQKGGLLFFAVGTGKTLITYLLTDFFEIMDNIKRRGYLLIPTRLKSKTLNDFNSLKTNWQISSPPNIITYEQVSRNPNILFEKKPEILIADECHKLSNPNSAVTKRVRRYLQKNGETIFVAMSGTLIKRSFKDWYHLCQWALPSQLQPLPLTYHQLESWCNALDEKPRYRISLGALKKLGKTRKRVLAKLGERFEKTPGIIMCGKNEKLPNLNIVYQHIEIPEITNVANYVRENWETPSGTQFILALDLYRHLREISQGFCYEWTQKPPKKWLQRRREFSTFIRKKLKNSKSLDTIAQIVDKEKNNLIVKKWIEIESIFKPRTKAIWFEYEYFRKILVPKNTLLWVSHDAVGKYLEKSCKYLYPYFSRNGLEKNGHSIEKYSGDIAIVSIQSISEGFNLQRYSNNVVLCPPKLGRKWEQLLGRTHRSGQTNDVNVTVYGTLPENKEDFQQAISDAKYIQQTSKPQKLASNKVVFND